MERQQTSPGGRRLLAAGAVASVFVVTAYSLARVFTGRAPGFQLVAAALASVALAALLERRGLWLAVPASVAGLVLAAGILVYPSTTFAGVPTADTLHAIKWAIGQVGNQVATQVAPTPPLGPLLLAAIAAVWAAAFATHALLVRAGSPAGAAFPCIALVAFTDLSLGQGPRPLAAGLVVAGMVAMLYADAMQRVDRWGPLRPWRSGRGQWAASRGARRVAFAAALCTIAIPALVPGFAAGSTWGIGQSGGTDVDPLVSIQASLTREDPIELFEVTADEPAYWRLIALDRFDGVSWTATDPGATTGQVVAAGGGVPLLPGGAVPPEGSTRTIHQNIRVLAMEGSWIPAAYRPTFIEIDTGEARFDVEGSFASMPGGALNHAHIRVTSQIPVPDPELLDVAGDPADQAAEGQLPADEFRRLTALPAATRRELVGIVANVTAGQPNAYRKVVAIQNWLRNSFTYDETATVPLGSRDPLVHFLTKSRRGFCQQFSSAMAAMARTLGYPARVAVGFQPGLATGGLTWAVTTDQAHAWPEIYFPGYGWLAFEPTPTRDDPIGAVYQQPAPYQVPSCGPRCQEEVVAGGGVPADLNPRINSTREGRHGDVAGFVPAGAPPRGGRSPWAPIGLLAGVLILLALVLIPPAKILARRLRLARARTPRARITAYLRNFETGAADVGAGRTPGETIEEYASRLRARVSFSDGHLARLARAAERAAYCAAPVSDEAVRAVSKDSSVALREVRRSMPLGRRIAALYRLEAVSERLGFPAPPRSRPG